MATLEFKKLAPGEIETEAAAQVAKEEKFIIDFVKDSYDLYLNDARLNPARNVEITKNQDKAITLFEEYEFEEKAKESERKTDQLNEIFDLESEIERMLSPVISSEIKMPGKEESKLVPRTSGKILDVRYKIPVVKGTVLEVKLIDKKEDIQVEKEETDIEKGLSEKEFFDNENLILDEVVRIALEEAEYQFATRSFDKERVEKAKKRLSFYFEKGIEWGNKYNFSITDIEDNGDVIYSMSLEYLDGKNWSWCGSFLAYCYKDFLKKNIRKKHMPSTYRMAIFAQKSQRFLDLEPLFEEIKQTMQRNLLILNSSNLNATEKNRKFNEIINIAKINFEKIFKKGWIYSRNPTPDKFYGTHFGIIAETEIFPYLWNEDLQSETDETDPEAILKFGINVVEGNTYDELEGLGSSVVYKNIDIESIFAVYRFLAEDYVDTKSIKKDEKTIANPEIKYIPKG